MLHELRIAREMAVPMMVLENVDGGLARRTLCGVGWAVLPHRLWFALPLALSLGTDSAKRANSCVLLATTRVRASCAASLSAVLRGPPSDMLTTPRQPLRLTCCTTQFMPAAGGGRNRGRTGAGAAVGGAIPGD